MRGGDIAENKKAVRRNVTWSIRHWTDVPFASGHFWPVWLHLLGRGVRSNVLLSTRMLELNFSPSDLQRQERMGTFLWLQGSSAPARMPNSAHESPLMQLCKTQQLGRVAATDHGAGWLLATRGHGEMSHWCIWCLILLTTWIQMGWRSGLWKPWGDKGLVGRFWKMMHTF